MKKFVFLWLIVVLLFFCVISCGKDEDNQDPIIPIELHGSWIRTVNENITICFTFTNDTISYIVELTDDTASLTVRVDTCNKENNVNIESKNEYSFGYNLKGKVISIENGSFTWDINDDINWYVFLNNLKDKYIMDVGIGNVNWYTQIFEKNIN